MDPIQENKTSLHSKNDIELATKKLVNFAVDKLQQYYHNDESQYAPQQELPADYGSIRNSARQALKQIQQIENSSYGSEIINKYFSYSSVDFIQGNSPLEKLNTLKRDISMAVNPTNSQEFQSLKYYFELNDNGTLESRFRSNLPRTLETLRGSIEYLESEGASDMDKKWLGGVQNELKDYGDFLEKQVLKARAKRGYKELKIPSIEAFHQGEKL